MSEIDENVELDQIRKRGVRSTLRAFRITLYVIGIIVIIGAYYIIFQNRMKEEKTAIDVISEVVDEQFYEKYLFKKITVGVVVFCVVVGQLGSDLVYYSMFKEKRVYLGIGPQMYPKHQSDADELAKYKSLLDSGAISQEEYEAKKKQILGL